MTEYEIFSLIIHAASFLILAIGVVIAVIQLHQIRKQRISEHDWNRRSKSITYSFNDDPEILRVLTRLDSHLQISSNRSSEISFADIECLSKSDYPEIINDIHFVLVRLGSMCTAIKHAVVDEAVCKDLLGDRTIDFFRFFRHYIETIRERRGTKNVLVNLEYYANKWSENDHFETRAPTGN